MQSQDSSSISQQQHVLQQQLLMQHHLYQQLGALGGINLFQLPQAMQQQALGIFSNLYQLQQQQQQVVAKASCLPLFKKQHMQVES